MKEPIEITPQEIHTLTINVGGVQIIKMEKGKFFFKGQEVEDKHEVYKKFKEFLSANKQ